jgi:hypothetical protein
MDVVKLTPGTRLRSVTDTTEVVVVRASAEEELDLWCGGAAMAPQGTDVPSGAQPSAGFDEGTKVGKRYEDSEAGLEVLCTKAGPGSLSIGARTLTQKDAKPLPSSD